jgi:hypothetical protein
VRAGPRSSNERAISESYQPGLRIRRKILANHSTDTDAGGRALCLLVIVEKFKAALKDKRKSELA